MADFDDAPKGPRQREYLEKKEREMRRNKFVGTKKTLIGYGFGDPPHSLRTNLGRLGPARRPYEPSLYSNNHENFNTYCALTLKAC
jgi:hypothetical protein